MVFYYLRISEITIIIFLFICCKIKKTDDFDILLADPTILNDNANYYLYGTTSGGAGKTNDGFLVYESDDLYNWKPRGFALKKGDAYGDQGFWAPHVFKNGEKYYMVYTANEKIAIAFSDSPLGPFTNDVKKPYFTDVKQLDPFILLDGSKSFLYHTRRVQQGNEIFVCELSTDLKSIKEETLQKCITTDQTWEDSDEIEPTSNQGPSVIKINNIYYMFYSANNFRSPKYAVGVARSLSPTGPWIKFDQNPILDSKLIIQNGPGHGDIFYDKDKKLNFVFHTHFAKNKIVPRKTAIISFSLNNDIQKINFSPETFRFLIYSR